jgi:hypothetical protein
MNVPPIIPLAEDVNKFRSISEILFRVIACITAGIVGYWFPQWYLTQRIPQDVNDRGGFGLVWGLGFIIGFATWATESLRLKPVIADKRKRLAAVAAILFLCWSSVIFTVASLVIVLVAFLFRQ